MILFFIGLIEVAICTADTLFIVSQRKFAMSITTALWALFRCLVIVHIAQQPNTMSLIVYYMIGCIIGVLFGSFITKYIRKNLIKKKRQKNMAIARQVKQEKQIAVKQTNKVLQEIVDEKTKKSL